MERTPSTPSSGESHKSSFMEILRNPRLAIGAAIMSALAGCGEPTAAKPEEIPECQEPERAEPGAPKVTMSEKGFELYGNQLRVNFTIPKFDEECRAPITVSVEATVWRNNQQANAVPSSSVVSLPGRTEMWASGEGFVDAEVPSYYNSLSSFTVVTVDAAGKKFKTSPVRLDF